MHSTCNYTSISQFLPITSNYERKSSIAYPSENIPDKRTLAFHPRNIHFLSRGSMRVGLHSYCAHVYSTTLARICCVNCAVFERVQELKVYSCAPKKCLGRFRFFITTEFEWKLIFVVASHH